MFATTVLLLLTVVAQSFSHSDDLTLASANNVFGLNLFRQLTSTNRNENVFFSPTSISTALAMIYAGAGGSSEEELSTVLGHAGFGLSSRDAVLAAYKRLLAATKTGEVTLDIANSVLVKKNLHVLSTFKNVVTESFDANLKFVDFVKDEAKVKSEVNKWVSQKTQGKIPTIIDNGDSLTDKVMILLNAVYFNGTWHTRFQTRDTIPRPFYNEGTKQVQVKTMALEGSIRHTNLEGLKAQAVELPYKGREYSMVIVLPDNKTGLSQLREKLTVHKLQEISSRMSAQTVSLTLPKFELQTNYDLIPTLQKMGLKSVFSYKSDLSGITGDKSLFLSDVRHKAMVEVNEEGTVAAAVTLVITARSAAPPIVNFNVDRPFLFYIRSVVTGRVFFMGEIHKL